MKKLFSAFIFLILSINSQAERYYGRTSPATAYLTLEGAPYDNFEINYGGWLFGCGGSRGDEGNRVNVIYVFTQDDGSRTSVKRTMGYSCPSAWNYTAPAMAYLRTTESTDPELWTALLSRMNADRTEIEVEVAFEYWGSWDSNFGQNYKIQLRPQL